MVAHNGKVAGLSSIDVNENIRVIMRKTFKKDVREGELCPNTITDIAVTVKFYHGALGGRRHESDFVIACDREVGVSHTIDQRHRASGIDAVIPVEGG